MCLKGLYEKCCNMHRDSINLFLHLVAAVVLVYSLWINSIEWILLALLIAVIGHIIEELNKKSSRRKKVREKPAKRKRKKGALEMSIGTIVIMVIAVTMLILGIVFVRSIMCSGIQMTQDLSKGTRAKIIELFGADEYGVRCVGEGDQQIVFGSGGRRNVVCVIKSDENVQYEIKVKSIENIKRPSDTSFESWVLDKDWEGSVTPGGKGTDATVAVLDIPKDAAATTLKFTMESTNMQTSTTKTHTSYIDVEPASFFTSTMC